MNAVHYQAGMRAGPAARRPVIACGRRAFLPAVTAIPGHVTCEACRRTRAWRDAYRTATTGGDAREL